MVNTQSDNYLIIDNWTIRTARKGVMVRCRDLRLKSQFDCGLNPGIIFKLITKIYSSDQTRTCAMQVNPRSLSQQLAR